ncbi:MAG: hypothetical protein PSV23_02415 [Brevundimonas sp.]|uniref:hypothetical protein n=1 Tax=Brevundimonas sp. TaxID=1871086 RepID=UPI002486EDC3|nr:hypothetical protein [Brevundimonas sp.]MDI1325631.1 hypothetical protein [Brevundimonas sp.]
MVIGLRRWQDHFDAYRDRYVMVGGVACDRLMEDAGLPFRATKDLDVVLLIEVLDAGFLAAFWAFIDAGGYEQRSRDDQGKIYRFEKPAIDDYPHTIELFSRAPEGFDLAPNAIFTPLGVEETAASLAAILLDDVYYDYLAANMREVGGLPLLSEAALIPFKARAFLDLSARKASGQSVDSKDIRKHRNDVFRMLQLLPGDTVQDVPPPIAGDMNEFVAAVRGDETFAPGSFEVKMSAATALARLSAAYGLA